MQQILAFSSSRVGNGGYLEKAAPVIANFLDNQYRHIAFIPFASVDSHHEYGNKVAEALSNLPCVVRTALPSNAKQIIEQSDVIMIGGGNTFKLLHDLYALDLADLIKQKVQSGTPYIGWSAGSNLTGPTICTTNDMPIIEPESLTAFQFFPFQINPHYHNVVMEGFHGETRDQRLEEFLKLNPHKQVVCLPEGTALQAKGGETLFVGEVAGVLLYNSNGVVRRAEIGPGTQLKNVFKTLYESN